MFGRGVFGKTLFNLINQSHSIAPEDLIPFEKLGIQKKDGSGPDVPLTFEEWAELNPIKK